MRIYYLVTKPALILLPDAAEKGLAKTPVQTGWAVLTPALEAVLKNIKRIKE